MLEVTTVVLMGTTGVLDDVTTGATVEALLGVTTTTELTMTEE